MPRKSRRPKINIGGRSRRRRSAAPNVYVAPEPEVAAGGDGAALAPAPGEVDGASDATPQAQARATRRQARSDARRVRGRRGRQAPLRAAVYGEYLGAELRKLAILTAALAVVLVVLTFTVG